MTTPRNVDASHEPVNGRLRWTQIFGTKDVVCSIQRYISSLSSLLLLLCIYFFFSSRRRHTRFDCDWSSDVCSSDLGAVIQGPRQNDRTHRRPMPARRAAEQRVDSRSMAVLPRPPAEHDDPVTDEQDRKSVV